MNIDKIKDLAIMISIITSSEFEFGDFEDIPGEHVKKIQEYTKDILTELQNKKYNGRYSLSEDDIATISYCAMFHDIGKYRVPWNIVHNPGKLTDEEFEEMKLHTVYGAEIIAKYKYVIDNNKCFDYLYNICKYHHERADGSGYPCHLKEDKIPFYAQVVGIVDTFNVCISQRSYKKSLPKDIALELLKKDKLGAFSKDIKEAAIKVFCGE